MATLHKKVIYPSGEEVYLNPCSCSAKLRAAAKADNFVLDLLKLQSCWATTLDKPFITAHHLLMSSSLKIAFTFCSSVTLC